MIEKINTALSGKRKFILGILAILCLTGLFAFVDRLDANNFAWAFVSVIGLIVAGNGVEHFAKKQGN